MNNKHLSRTFRRIKKKLASKIVIHYKKRNPSVAKCGSCGKALQAVPRKQPTKMHNLAKTKKRPERPYGGVLCTKCLRATMVTKARSL
jgi:large subunit ribosomal protein L34e